MPKIKVYKHGSNIIPVEGAKVTTGFQCPFSKKLYVTKHAYMEHLKRLRRENHLKIYRNTNMDRLTADLNNQPSFDAIIKWFDLHGAYFLARAKHRYGSNNKNWPDPDEFWIKLTYLRVSHGYQSNSHSAPRGMRTNWCGHQKDIPKGYPGWGGYIEFQTSHDLPSFGGDVLRGTGINTGTGGGASNNRFGYGVTFFDYDWPELTKEIEKVKVYKTLKSEEYKEPKFTYGEPRYFS